jgi:hypothetical protein
VDEVRNAQNGLVNRISQLKRLLGDSRVSASDKAQFQAELSEASRLLDHSEHSSCDPKINLPATK